MASIAKDLRAFLEASPAALVEVVSARGSTPRERGAWMLVSPTAIFGTIGGGQLEYMAIDKARQRLVDVGAAPHPYPLPVKNGERGVSTPENPLSPSLRGEGKGEGQRGGQRLILDIPLGPEIGQCCGGRVEVAISLVDCAQRETLVEMAKAEERKQPHVYMFGGGHVGQALASAFALLPLRTIVVESRAEALVGMPESIETRLTPVPEEMVRGAPAGSAFVVLTHDHALDFLIVAEALKRGDAAYVGMIGSRTKKATFRSWFLKVADGTDEAFSRLVSPIGGDAVRDKRPAVIAALAAAEVMTTLALASSASVKADAQA